MCERKRDQVSRLMGRGKMVFVGLGWLSSPSPSPATICPEMEDIKNVMVQFDVWTAVQRPGIEGREELTEKTGPYAQPAPGGRR